MDEKDLDEKYMKEALKQAQKAYAINEVPIGCVIVRQGKIIARGYNKRNSVKSTLGHAEIEAIKKAGKAVGDWRLEDCIMYVTLEPCPMCAGAILNSRIEKVYFGAYDKKSGCAGSAVNLFDRNLCNFSLESEGGILEEECSGLMKDFFRELRKRKK